MSKYNYIEFSLNEPALDSTTGNRPVIPFMGSFRSTSSTRDQRMTGGNTEQVIAVTIPNPTLPGGSLSESDQSKRTYNYLVIEGVVHKQGLEGNNVLPFGFKREFFFDSAKSIPTGIIPQSVYLKSHTNNVTNGTVGSSIGETFTHPTDVVSAGTGVTINSIFSLTTHFDDFNYASNDEHGHILLIFRFNVSDGEVFKDTYLPLTVKGTYLYM